MKPKSIAILEIRNEIRFMLDGKAVAVSYEQADTLQKDINTLLNRKGGWRETKATST